MRRYYVRLQYQAIDNAGFPVVSHDDDDDDDDDGALNGCSYYRAPDKSQVEI